MIEVFFVILLASAALAMFCFFGLVVRRLFKARR